MWWRPFSANSVEQEIPTFFSRKKVKKVFGWGGDWGEGFCCLFFPKGSKSFAATTTKAVTSQSLEESRSKGWCDTLTVKAGLFYFFLSLVQKPPDVISRILFHLFLPYLAGA